MACKWLDTSTILHRKSGKETASLILVCLHPILTEGNTHNGWTETTSDYCRLCNFHKAPDLELEASHD